jgi:hypothetical protein
LKPDITPLLEARYTALIRLTLEPGARLTAFAFDGYLMTAPLSLPRLAEGPNRMTLRSGDKFSRPTLPWTVPVDFRSETALRGTLVRLERGSLQPWKRNRLLIAPAVSGPARALFRFEAPEPRRFAWAYALATVPEGPANAPPRQAELAWSTNGLDWTPIGRLAIPSTPLQWDASLDGELIPASPCPVLWLRINSETGLVALELAGHLEAPPCPDDLQITHLWAEDDGPRDFTVPPGRMSYELVCGKNPRAHTIELRAPRSVRHDLSL